MLKLDQITRLHIELTTKCNARCPKCPRNYHGYEYNSGYPDTELSLDDFKTIFPVEFLRQIKVINFNGNLGDCSMAKDFHGIVEYVIQASLCEIHIQTNGSARKPEWWAALANPRIRISFAIDGLEDTHHLYRQDTIWQNVIQNACAYIQAGGYANWKMIVFEHNKHQIEICKQLSSTLGFKNFVTIDQGRNQGPVYTRHGKFVHWLGVVEETVPDLNELIKGHVTFSRSIPKDLDNEIFTQVPDCKHLLFQELYVAADGSVYPCCFLGFYPSTMNHPGNNQIRSLIHENNALQHGLEHCLDWFESVERSWTKDNISSGRLYTCQTTCGSKQ
jgi:MoaA/NifB/PqqE/SkfB family radical SAM enzyme